MPRRLLREVLLVAGMLVPYSLGRFLVAGHGGPALANAEQGGVGADEEVGQYRGVLPPRRRYWRWLVAARKAATQGRLPRTNRSGDSASSSSSTDENRWATSPVGDLVDQHGAVVERLGKSFR